MSNTQLYHAQHAITAVKHDDVASFGQ